MQVRDVQICIVELHAWHLYMCLPISTNLCVPGIQSTMLGRQDYSVGIAGYLDGDTEW
jgi:hypothetical protein